MDGHISPIDPLDSSQSARIQKQAQAKALEETIQIEASEDSLTAYADEAAFNPVNMARRFETLEEKRKKIREERTEKTEDKGAIVKEVEETAELYSRNNPELNSRALLMLRSRLSSKDTPEEILRKILEAYPDHSLADEVIDFLIDTSEGDLNLANKRVKEDLNESHGREVRAGRNIAQQAREFSQQGLGTPTGLRDLYREITGNPRDAPTLFEELSLKFSFQQMNPMIKFFLHALGADLKSKGPSISRGELHRLMTEGRNLQAILWVYRFFQSRMSLIRASFEKYGLLYPTALTFEMLAKNFVHLLVERYPNMDKVLQLALKLGISSELVAQLIIFTQMRDAVRMVAPKLFRSDQHRHDVLLSFLEALEELEEKLEEEEEKEEGDEKKKDKDEA